MDTRVKPAYDAWSKMGGLPIMTPLEKVNSMKMPFAELKGVTFTEAERDRVVARMLVRADLCTLNHTIHGDADADGALETRVVIALVNGSVATFCRYLRRKAVLNSMLRCTIFGI